MSWWPKKKTDPVPAPTPEPNKPPKLVDYVKAWSLLKQIPIHKLGRVVGLTSAVVFFAISGLIAWFALFVRFFFSISF